MYIKKKFRKNSEAVSPVVATLILVLVAVASATAFYLWQTEWQAGQTEKIDDSQPQSSIDVAGSTTVYEFAVIAGDEFMKDYPLYEINIIGGGSSVGVTALIEGSADIGMVSDGGKLTEAKSKNAEVRGYTLGYDAVTPIASAAALKDHKIDAAKFVMNKTVSRAIYFGLNFGVATNPSLHWGDLYNITMANGYITAAGVLVQPTAGGTLTDNDAIKVVHRSDSSGTEAYWAKLLTSYKDAAGVSQSQEVQLDEVVDKVADLQYFTNKATIIGGNGNTGVVAECIASVDAIGFASWGVAAADTGIVIPKWSNFAATTGAPVAADAHYDQTMPNLMANLAKANNIRPLIVMTIGPAEGVEKLFIDYMLEEANNKAFCAEANYISLYK